MMTRQGIRRKIAQASDVIGSLANVLLGELDEEAQPAPASSPPPPLTEPQFALIVGAQRSGTTWLQKMCCAHPQLAGGTESQLFSKYLGKLTAHYYSDLAPDEPSTSAKGLPCFITPDEFRALYRHFALTVFRKLLDAKPGATIAIEKTPDHVLHLKYITSAFPSASIIHIIRDGRDVAVSQIAAAKTSWGKDWAPTTARDAAGRWVEWVQRGREASQLTRHYHELRYEDLLHHGPETLAKVFEFLKVPLPREQVQSICDAYTFEAFNKNTAPNPFVRRHDAKPVSGTNYPESFFRKGKAGGWMDALTPDEVAQVMEVAGPLLQELGYLESGDEPVNELSITVPAASN